MDVRPPEAQQPAPETVWSAAQPSPTEALEFRPDNALIGGQHNGSSLNLFEVNISNCGISSSGYDIDYNDIFVNLINKGMNKKDKIYVFIDEVQHYPEISKVIKYLTDHYQIKFVITGSASYYLKNLFPESLAGRKIIFELYPLDFQEFLIFKKQDLKKYEKIKNKKNINIIDHEYYDKLYEEFVEWGGFPEVVLEENFENKTELLNDIFSSYFQKEIIALADYRKNDKVRDLILLLSQGVGSKLDIDRLSQELQITRATVYSYLSFLEATYFIYLVSPFSQSIDRIVSGAQKVYFCDNGILKIMAKLKVQTYLYTSECLYRMKTKIILDTNFLLIPVQFKVDIYSEIDRICDFSYELVTVKEVVSELEHLIAKGSKSKKAAKLALQMLKKFQIRTLRDRKVFKRADEAIIAIADKNSIVATQDMELKRLLKKNAVRLIVLRQKQYLKLFGE